MWYNINMTNLLRKLFIKNYKDVENSKVREQHGLLAGIVGIIFNTLLFSGKLIVGFISSSISVIGDAINNLSDLGSSIITVFGFKISSKPADEDHPFGHERVEYIAGLVISIIIIVIGVQLISSSVSKIIDGGRTTYDLFTYIILGASIVIKIFLALFNYKLSKEINSLTLKASSKDCINDVIATSVILISVIIGNFMDINIDGYMGVVVGLFIIFSGTRMIKDTVDPLIGSSADKELVNKIKGVIKQNSVVIGLHDIICHSYGPTKLYMTAHIEVASDSDLVLVHDEIDNIERDVYEKFNVHLVIHIDPICTSCETTNKLKVLTAEVISSLPGKIEFYDFRIVDGATHINVIMDILKPHKYELSEGEVSKEIAKYLNSNYSEKKEIRVVINYNSSFIKK